MDIEEITRHELENRIYTGKLSDLDFYAYCNTPWHAIGIQAFVNDLAEKKESIRGVVFLSNQPGRKNIVEPEDFIFKDNVTAIYFKNVDAFRSNKKEYLKKLLFSKRDAKLQKDHEFYMLRPFRADYKFGAEYQIETGRKCHLICLEEGVGTYKSDYEIFKEKRKGSFKAGMLYLAACAFNAFLKRRYKLLESRFTMFDGAKNHLTVNEYNANLYLKTIQKKVMESGSKCEVLLQERYVLLITQPFEIAQDKACEKQINETFDQIKNELEKKNIKVYIKPHPRESKEVIDDYESRGYIILREKMPIETFLEMLPHKPLCVIGAHSTALVTASVLNQVEAVSIIDMLKNADKDYMKTAKIFKERYGKFVRTPLEITEII